jgi:hypothetical protein
MADAGRALPEQLRAHRRWWSPVALVAVFAAALLMAGPWAPLAAVGLGPDCAAAATPNHVGVVVDFSGQGAGNRKVVTKCVAWIGGQSTTTAYDALKLAFPSAILNATTGRVCQIDIPDGGCVSPPPSEPAGFWTFSTAAANTGSWMQQTEAIRQDQPIADQTIVGWKYTLGSGPAGTPAVTPNLVTICSGGTTATPTPTKTPSKTPTSTPTTGAPGAGSNPGTGTGGYTPPPYTYPTGQPTQPSAGYPGLPGTTGIGDAGGNVTPGGGDTGKLPANRAAAYDTKDWTRWGLILVAAGFALVIVTMGLFGTNVYLSRKAAPKGRHRRGERRSFAV